MLHKPRRKKLRDESHASEAFICKLPLEILLLITAHLSLNNRWCLALTCRSFYRFIAQYYPEHPVNVSKRYPYLLWRVDNRLPLNYWRRCARDLPDHLVCSTHDELYLWRRQKQVGYQCPKSSKIRHYDPVTPALCSTYEGIRVCRHTRLYMTGCCRKLILRYYTYGPEWGLPVSTLKHSCKGRISKTVFERKHIEGKIIDGKRLMVKTITNQSFNVHFGKYWPVRAESWMAAVCRHSHAELWLILQRARDALHLARVTTKADLEDRVKLSIFDNRWFRCSTLLKCQYCATDVRVRVRRTTAQKLEIEVATYHDLGGLATTPIQDGFFAGCYHKPPYVPDRPPEEYAERLECSLEALYEGNELVSPPRTDSKLSHGTDTREATVSASNTVPPSSAIMAHWCPCREQTCKEHIPRWARECTYSEWFIEKYDVLQFEPEP